MGAFDASLGALEIGILISIFLFGMVTVQTYIYYRNFAEDPRWMKVMVASIWALELGHSIAVAHTLYIITVSDFGNTRNLAYPPKSLFASSLLSGIITPVVQAFFAHRLHQISRKLWIAIVCWFLLFLRCLSIIGLSTTGIISNDLVAYEKKNGWLIVTVLTTGAAADIVISGSLCYFLLKNRSQSFNEYVFALWTDGGTYQVNALCNSTVVLIDRLIALTLQTSLLTCLTTLAMLICYLSMASNDAWIALYVVISRIFSNSLLASLNARVDLREIEKHTVSGNRSRARRSARMSASVPMFEPIGAEMQKSRTPPRLIDSDSSDPTFTQQYKISGDTEEGRSERPSEDPSWA
ncbi:hypothetical protein PLICRDRAFT_179967 [Plicaturopsis crispa FD-325 SS-3]|uniref:DUF6534 domain-containing protein n=1 Tax=Plicaturopsis crispa FD-325 SS-3 TaxID=944288 RepID=A0A0C9T720_PLICR|nr:hypothetical protein PLICRDRAFT_179967 [Plicaturopsis crispa FD-325 SS-3]